MKLLLTSAGITNESIKRALLSLLPKPIEECCAVFIPTAANVEEGVAKMAEKVKEPVYSLDDNSAVQFIDGVVTVIFEGKWKKFE